MSAGRTIRICWREKGMALLISIFILLLISVVAIALIVSSGTESSLAGNYRSATGVNYAAMAGLEEARGRLLARNPDYVLNADPNFLPPPGTPLAIGDARYIFNPNPALNENMGNMLTLYPDNEYFTEFGAQPNPTRPPIASVSPNNAQGIQGPPYKWIRINAVSEQSLNLDVQPIDGNLDKTTPVFYDGANLNTSNSGAQVFEITSLAVLPNGSRKLLQYLVAAPAVNLNLPTFPAALSLLGGPGNSVTFNASADPSANVRGIDQDTVGSCSPGPAIPAIAVLTNPDTGNVINGVPPGARSHYKGSSVPPGPGPDVQDVSGSLPPSLQTPAGLEALAQAIIHNADVPPISGPATGSSLPASMYTPSPNPMTIVVNGDLDLSGWNQTGYGLLLVRGNLTYDPGAAWRGVILVIGQGTTVTGAGSGGGDFDGAVLVANTLDSSGQMLAHLGSVTMDYSAITNGEGIHYSSCWIQAAMPAIPYRILSFHEIPQP